jgi:hypothetical protein
MLHWLDEPFQTFKAVPICLLTILLLTFANFTSVKIFIDYLVCNHSLPNYFCKHFLKGIVKVNDELPLLATTLFVNFLMTCCLFPLIIVPCKLNFCVCLVYSQRSSSVGFQHLSSPLSSFAMELWCQVFFTQIWNMKKMTMSNGSQWKL